MSTLISPLERFNFSFQPQTNTFHYRHLKSCFLAGEICLWGRRALPPQPRFHRLLFQNFLPVACRMPQVLSRLSVLNQHCSRAAPSQLLLSPSPSGLIKGWIRLSLALINPSALWEAARAFFNQCSFPVASTPCCDVQSARAWKESRTGTSPLLLLIVVNCNGQHWECPGVRGHCRTWRCSLGLAWGAVFPKNTERVEVQPPPVGISEGQESSTQGKSHG